MAYHLQPYGNPPVVGQSQSQSIPKLRLKPSSTKLRSKKSLLLSNTPPPPPTTPSSSSAFLRSRTEPTLPTLSTLETSIYTRKERKPSSLPKPMASSVNTSPVVTLKSRTSPPTKHHAAFTAGGSIKAIPSVASIAGTASSAAGGSEKRILRNVIRRKNSASNSHANFVAGLGNLRTNSSTSVNASTSSLVTSNSSIGGGGGGGRASRNASQSSILGITLPATSSSSSPSLVQGLYPGRGNSSRNGSISSSVPRIMTRDLPTANMNLSTSGSAYESSPSTRYSDSPGPFSHSTTPISSVSSHSPGFARARTTSPSRPPVTRNRTGSLSNIDLEGCDVGLDSVRESTTSTSSGSTIRGACGEVRIDRGFEDEDDSEYTYARPPSPPVPGQSSTLNRTAGSISAPTTPFMYPSKSPRLNLSPQQISSGKSSSSPAHSSAASRRKVSAPTMPSASRPSKEDATGLGVTIPTIQGNAMLGSVSHSRSRSKSLTTTPLSQQRQQRKDPIDTHAQPPLPESPDAQPPQVPRKNSIIIRGPTPLPRDPVVSTVQGFPYHTIPPPSKYPPGSVKRGDSKERTMAASAATARERSPQRSSPGKSASSLKTSFFSRGRSRTTETEPEKQQQQIGVRRGPVAGTGHEVYGAFTKGVSRGRSGSISGASITGSYNRSGSASSTNGSWGRSAGSRAGSRGSKADMEMDEYLLDRLKPVVMAGGGGVVENHNFPSSTEMGREMGRSDSSLGVFEMGRTGSGQGSSREKSSLEMGRTGSAQSYSRRQPSPVFMSREESSDSLRAPSRAMTSSRDGSEIRETVASRRAHLTSRRAPTPIPTPINTSAVQRPPPSPGVPQQTPKDRRAASGSATEQAQLQVSPPLATDPIPTKKRWNFLQRTQAAVQRQATPAPPITPVTPGASRKPISRRQAHYALLDQEEQREAADLAERIKEIRHQHVAEAQSNYTTALRNQHHVHSNSVLLPDPPLPPSVTSPSPIPQTHAKEVRFEPARKEVKPAPPPVNERKRLLQVGRIPAVTSRNRADPVPENVPPRAAPGPPAKDKSATRGQLLPPLLTKLTQQGPANNVLWSAPPKMGADFKSFHGQKKSEDFQVNWDGYGLTPTTAGPGFFESSKTYVAYDPLDTRGKQYPGASVSSPMAETPIFRNGELLWPVRKSSVTTPVTAIPVGMLVPQGEEEEEEEEEAVQEDDVWDEFDDLLDSDPFFFEALQVTETKIEETQPAKKIIAPTGSATSSLGSPFQYEDLCDAFPDLADLLTTAADEEDEIEEEDVIIDKGVFVHDSPTLPPAPPAKTVPPSLPLVKSRVSDLIDLSDPYTPPAYRALTPSTPFSLYSFIRSYSDRDSGFTIETTGSRSRLGSLQSSDASTITAVRKSHTRSKGSKGSNGSSVGVSSKYSSGSGGSLILDGEEEEDEMKIRLWALMTSRWLSFDKVLVSPAHERLQSIGNGGGATAGGRVLVVDGLGTDDWSFYCALSYPSAKVYNLSPSFAPVIPAAPSPGQDTANASASARPPNHQQIHHPSLAASFPFPKGFFNVISFRFLPSSSDSSWPFILSECKRVLEPGGHLEITVLDAELVSMGSRTRRAVDLVKAIMERENETSSSEDETGRRRRRKNRPTSEKVLRGLQKRGFEDLSQCFLGLPVVGKIHESISSSTTGKSIDSTTQPNTDPIATHSIEDPESMNEVVSKVARWWYTRCYERVITGEGESPRRSMWNDRGLLRECGRKKTKFALLVCHARKPIGGRMF